MTASKVVAKAFLGINFCESSISIEDLMEPKIKRLEGVMSATVLV